MKIAQCHTQQVIFWICFILNKVAINLLLHWEKDVDDMEFRLTSESMELLIESIIDAVEFIDDRDMQFKLVKTILEDNGIVEIKE